MTAVPLEPRHRQSGLNSRFNGNPVNGKPPTFADYVARTRSMLSRAHAGKADRDKLIEGNAPFEFRPADGYPPGQRKPCRRGVLLIHGLTDSPYSMRHLAGFFRHNGFRVMAVLLPGHGTQPGDLLDVRWQEWAKTVAFGAYKLAEEADDIYLAGYSTGATLSVYQSLRDERLRGLFLFSPAFRITSRAALAKLHKLYSWLIPSGKWLDIKPDRDIYKYESFAKNAAAQTYDLTRQLQRQLRERVIDIPVFIAASEDDTTVDVNGDFEFLSHATHPLSRMVLYTTRPDRTLPGHLAGRMELVNSVFPDQHILGSSHTAIVIPPEDAHYGRGGSYSNCIHYYPDDMQKYNACIRNPEQDLQGEVTVQNLQTGLLRRLMYNPNYAMLLTSMQRFIEDLP